MAVESAADRAAFLDPEEFGDRAVWTPQLGAPTIVFGIFDGEYVAVEIDSESGVAVTSTTPMLHVRTADLPGVQDGDGLRLETLLGEPVWRSEYRYTIREPQPDGTGMSMLKLEKI